MTQAERWSTQDWGDSAVNLAATLAGRIADLRQGMDKETAMQMSEALNALQDAALSLFIRIAVDHLIMKERNDG